MLHKKPSNCLRCRGVAREPFPITKCIRGSFSAYHRQQSMNVVFGGMRALSVSEPRERCARTLIFWYINFKHGVLHFSRSVWSLDRAFHRHDLKHCRITATLECVRAGFSYNIIYTHYFYIPAPRAAREVSLDASRLWNFIRVVITISWETRERSSKNHENVRQQ
jgi:hypothetical protein